MMQGLEWIPNVRDTIGTYAVTVAVGVARAWRVWNLDGVYKQSLQRTEVERPAHRLTEDPIMHIGFW